MHRTNEPAPRRWSRGRAWTAALPALLMMAAPAAAQEDSSEWLERCREEDGRRAVHCEVRETRLAATGALTVNARPNGGVRVVGWDRDEVLVRARVQARAETEAAARELAGRVRVNAKTGAVSSEGPRTSRRESWSVSYEVFVPRRTDLSLESVNGGLSVREVHGRLELETTNGGISLREVGGSVSGETTNGGLDVHLSGSRLEGDGLELRTSNGSVSLTVPDGFSAALSARTVNGGIQTDFPITVQGRIGRRLEAELGGGGPPIRISTVNGAIRLRRG